MQHYVPNLYRSQRNASRLTSSPLGRPVGSDKRRCPKAFVIAEPCIGTKDTACVDACPVDCIHPKKNTTYDDARPGFDEVPQLYIDPIECIDCGACVPVCPVRCTTYPKGGSSARKQRELREGRQVHARRVCQAQGSEVDAEGNPNHPLSLQP